METCVHGFEFQLSDKEWKKTKHIKSAAKVQDIAVVPNPEPEAEKEENADEQEEVVEGEGGSEEGEESED